MAHLDRDVAAFVDGQLSPEATASARRHVADCVRCRDAVAQQRLLKSRMQAGAAPSLPPSLLASLSSLPELAEPETRRERFRRSRAVCAGAALAGASFVVVALAFVAGAHEDRIADPVQPSYEHYVADFASGHTSAVGTMTVQAMAELDEQGWPCHPQLAGDLRRVDGRWHGDADDVISLTYTDGRYRLRLFEKAGTLDDDAVATFTHRKVGDRQVWIDEGNPRTGSPTVVTWDADGIVFTAVTDVGEERLAAVLDDLPQPREPRGAAGRMGDGLTRMTAWVSP